MTESSLTDRELIEIDTETGFTHDARGRIVADNEPDGGPAPRFVFSRTRQGNTWRVGHTVPDDVARWLDELADNEPVQDDLVSPPVNFNAMRAALGEGPAPEIGRELIYRFPEKLPAYDGVTRITRATIPLLHRMVFDVADVERDFESGEPSMVIVVDGAAVSVCYSCRLTDRGAAAGLETLEEYRGRGYAPAVTAAWARAVRESGRIPFYSTQPENTASQAVARKMGLVQYAVGFGID